MKQIAREAKAKFIDQLSDDELPAAPNNSFIGMMTANMVTMTEALGGNSTCMGNIDAATLHSDSPLVPAVKLTGVSARYEQNVVFDDLCLEIAAGQFAGIVGPRLVGSRRC